MINRIAFLGTGLMGRPMARNLLAAGFSVTVWNRTRAKAEELAAEGASVADSPTQAATGAEVVITMLADGPITTAVLFDQGVSDALSSGATMIDMASIPPATAQEHARRLAERGVGHLDAPVSGGTRGAAAGTLAIMVGGDPAEFERRKSLFEPLGRAVLVGPAGSGQLAKLANQAIVGITIGAVSEALLLAAAGGADPAAVREALSGGFADSRILQEHGRRMLERDFRPGAPVRIQVKDMETILSTARGMGLELPLSDRVGELFTRLRDTGGAEYDHSALLLLLEQDNPPHKVGKDRDGIG